MTMLKEAEEGGSYISYPNRIHTLRDEIQKLQAKEECMWKQRSRNDWLKEGDRNTKYFHCRENQRNPWNLILGLEDEDGNWVEDEASLGRVVENYFATIFTISNPSGFDQILHGIHRVVDEDENNTMGSEFLASEVQQALSQMAPLNTLGCDGMSPIFYKSFWHIVGEDVTSVVLKALNTGCVLESLNTTFISLIPKIKNPNLFIYFFLFLILDLLVCVMSFIN